MGDKVQKNWNELRVHPSSEMTDSGWKMSGDDTGIYLEKGDIIIHFDIPITTPEGRIWAIKFKRTGTNSEFTLAANPAGVTMSIEQAHQYCGHNSMQETRRTAEHLGWKVKGCWRYGRRCESCAVGKAKKTNLGPGESKLPATIGELWGIDGMKLKRPVGATVPFPSNCCMNMAVDHKTGAAFLGWYSTKKDFIKPFCSKLNHWEATTGLQVKRIRCDDAGENKSFQKEILGHWKKPIKFEFTAKTPQRNSRVETKIFHICNKTRAAMEAANIPDKYRYLIFPLFSKWCCQTDMLTVIEVDGVSKTRHEHLTGSLPGWIGHLQIAGMAGVVKTHTGTT